MGIQINGQTDTITAIDGSITVGTDLTVPGSINYDDVTNIDSVGIITAQAGINISGGDLILPDSITHAGDTNTKIRFPAADTITAETSGSERLRITSDGSVGTGGLVASSGNLVVNSTIRSQNSSSNISYIGFTQYTGDTSVGSMFSYMGGVKALIKLQILLDQFH